ncbi:MAG: O-antigen ligase family protein [Pseudomonadota bacterium]
MEKTQVQNAANTGRALVFGRTLAFFVVTALAAPALIMAPKSMPAIVGVALLILGLAHSPSRFRHIVREQNRRTLRFWQWSPCGKALLASYVALVGWMYVSLIYSPRPAAAFPDILALAVAPVVASIMANEFVHLPRRTLVLGMTLGVLGLALLIISENLGLTRIYLSMPAAIHINGLNRPTTTAVLMLAPLLVFSSLLEKRRFVWLVLAFVLVSAAQALSENQGSQLAMIGMLVAGFLLTLSRIWLPIILGAIGLSLLVFPLLLPMLETLTGFLPDTLRKAANLDHRFGIWNGYADLVGQAPFLGWGVEAHRHFGMMGFDLPEAFGRQVNHPHNASLELWLNFGLVGVVLALVCLFCLYRALRELRLLEQVAAVQIVVAAYVYLMSSTAIMQGWWVATLTLVSALFWIARRVRNQPSSE